jgi:hypothetical protein
VTRTLAERRRVAIARARARREQELAPLRAEVARAVAAVGWRRAKPVIAQVLGPRWHVGGPRGPWWDHVGRRSGARILAELAALPAQGRLPLRAPERRETAGYSLRHQVVAR